MKDQEGPYLGLTPARYYKSCSGCKYHKHTLVKSGYDPEYRDDCTHESAPKPRFKLSFTGNLNNDNGYAEPGDWCPFDAVNQINVP